MTTGYGTRTPMVIVSPWARRGAYAHRTTNISILSFMQHLWGIAPLNSLNAQQNDLAGAFDFRQRPLRRPRLPVAPSATIGFHGKSLASEVRAVHPHHWLRIYLDAETTGLSLSAGLSGWLSLSLATPWGVAHPASFPSRTQLRSGRAMIRVRFAKPGYYRVTAALRGRQRRLDHAGRAAGPLAAFRGDRGLLPHRNVSPGQGRPARRGGGDGQPHDQDERERHGQGHQDRDDQRDGGPDSRRGSQQVEQAIGHGPGCARPPRLPGRCRWPGQNGNRQTPNASPNRPRKFVPSFHR